MAEENEYIREAVTELGRLSADAQKRYEYERRQYEIFVYQSNMNSARKKGLEKGTTLINQLHKQLIADGRIDELTRSCDDKELQQKLLSEYKLI